MKPLSQKRRLLALAIFVVAASVGVTAAIAILSVWTPFLLGFAVASFAITMLIRLLIELFIGVVRGEPYLQKNHFYLWKRGHSINLKERWHAGKEIAALRSPTLDRWRQSSNRCNLYLLTAWLVVNILVAVYLLRTGK